MPEFLAETYAPRPAAGPAAPGVAGMPLAAGPASGPGAPARCPGAVAVPGDQTCLCPYQAPSAGAARGAMTRAELLPGRITRAVTARPPRTRPGLAPGTQATTGPPAPSPGPRGSSARPPQLPASVRAAALFASDLPYDRHPGAAAVEAAISSALTARGGIDGCVGALAAAYEDHPDTAVPRMKWARQTIDAMRPAGRPLSASGKKAS
jgi:hypothetical protein